MTETAKLSQKDSDAQTQRRLTESVGLRLERQEKTTTPSPWSSLKRLLRLG
jgi:hypothetical protein